METLAAFWELVKDVWINGLYGTNIGRYVTALLILLCFLLVRRLFTRLVLSRVRHFTARTTTEFDDRLVAALEPPVRFVPIVLGIFFASQYLSLEGLPAAFMHRVNQSLIVFAIFWGLFNFVEPLTSWFKRLEQVFTPSLVDWLIKAMKGAFLFLGAATILDVWGIQVGPIIAGLGLLGVAVALGAQDLFKNLISGILILAERRFMRGDWIRVEGVVEGTVESIGFRSTLVRRFDKAPVYVPNAKLSDSLVINFSKMTHRRIYWNIGIKYSATVDQLREIREGIATYVTCNPDFAKPPLAEMFVRIDGFGESAIDVMLYCFTRTTAWSEWLKIKEELAYKIKEIVEGAGAEFALPGRSVYVETLPTERPEAFVPPGEGGEEEEPGAASAAADPGPQGGGAPEEADGGGE